MQPLHAYNAAEIHRQRLSVLHLNDLEAELSPKMARIAHQEDLKFSTFEHISIESVSQVPQQHPVGLCRKGLVCNLPARLWEPLIAATSQIPKITFSIKTKKCHFLGPDATPEALDAIFRNCKARRFRKWTREPISRSLKNDPLPSFALVPFDHIALLPAPQPHTS